MTNVALGISLDGALIIPSQLPVWCHAALGWTDKEPMELVLSIQPAKELCPDCGEVCTPLKFRFARSLLDAAILAPEIFHGDGDIQLSFDPDDLELDDDGKPYPAEPCLRVSVLDNAGAWQLFVLDGHQIVPFMTQTYFRVPREAEYADVDGALAQLLGKA